MLFNRRGEKTVQEFHDTEAWNYSGRERRFITFIGHLGRIFEEDIQGGECYSRGADKNIVRIHGQDADGASQEDNIFVRFIEIAAQNTDGYILEQIDSCSTRYVDISDREFMRFLFKFTITMVLKFANV